MNGTRHIDRESRPGNAGDARFLQGGLRAVFLVGAVLLLAGCGADGSDGDSFIAYSWVSGPITFYTEDPAFEGQEAIYNESYVNAVPGTWYMEYQAWDGSQWWAEYEIYLDEGEDGGLFTDGDDGVDLYFELAAYSIGPSFYVWEGEPYGAAAVTLGSAAELGAAGVTAAERPGSGEVSEDDREASTHEPGLRAPATLSTGWPDPSQATTERHRGEGYTVELRTGRLE
ncbi:MAG: hypothetical protein ACOCYB_07775 [Alkalispirochaeta sp.]